MILVCSRSWKGSQAEEGIREKETNSATGNRKRLLWTLFTLLAYILLFETLGFLLSTFLFFVSLFKLTKAKGEWVTTLMLSAGSVAATYMVFSVWLKCQLPAGILAF